jgi:hypothetical protein
LQPKSSLSRGLLYGAASGGVVAIVVGAMAPIGGAGWREVLQGCIVSFFTWGAIGFLLGFFSHREPATDAAGNLAIRRGAFSIMKQWVYRVIVGFVLGGLAAGMVELMHVGFIVVIYGGLDEFFNRKLNREEMRLNDLGLFAMIGSATGAMLGGFMGALIAPIRYENRSIIRSSMMAAAFGALGGAWFGGAVSLLYPEYLNLGWIFTLAIIIGVLAGAGGAVVLRLRVNR